MLDYDATIEEYLLVMKNLHGKYASKNPHPLVHWSGLYTIQSYVWKLKKKIQF